MMFQEKKTTDIFQSLTFLNNLQDPEEGLGTLTLLV